MLLGNIKEQTNDLCTGRWIFNAFCQVKKASPKRLHVTWSIWNSGTG